MSLRFFAIDAEFLFARARIAPPFANGRRHASPLASAQSPLSTA